MAHTFKNNTIDYLKDTIINYRDLSNEYKDKKIDIYTTMALTGIMISLLSFFIGVYLKETNNDYLFFISIPFGTGVLLCLVGYFLQSMFLDNHVDYLPNLFANHSKINQLEVVSKDLFGEISKSKVQLELIDFFDKVNINSEYLKLQFATQDYMTAISETNRLFNKQIIEEDLKKRFLIETNIIQEYEKQLKA